jgi:hypothetical protein
MKEHEIQYSISAGVAKVLRSEVAVAQGLLRNGQRRGIKFEVAEHHVNVESKSVPAAQQGPGEGQDGADVVRSKGRKCEPGHCAKCGEPFTEWEAEMLVGFTCGHVFHLAHLMECIRPGEVVDKNFMVGGMEEEAVGSTHFVGPKVTRARLLRDRIRGGCPVCVGGGDG